MGHEITHVYRLSCLECGEEMAVALHVNYEVVSTRVEEVENAEPIQEDSNCRIVNIHANFVIPEDQRHEDMSFPHLPLMVEMAEKGSKVGSLISAKDAVLRINERPFRRPDFDAEWKILKKTWSLYRRGKHKLSSRLLEEASAEFYANNPLKDTADWVWRFALFSTGIEYEPKLQTAMEAIKEPLRNGKLNGVFMELENTSSQRGEQYYAIIRDYFSSWSEFSQVHFSVGSGVDTQNLSAKTSNFSTTQMYYGNAFEVFGSLVDILTMINNVICGREYDKLSKITLAEYRASDKGKRFDAPAQNLSFASLFAERDNQLRNASHHRELRYAQTSGLVSYNLGKGGTGELREISYAEYLAKCSRMHHQIILILRLELLICQAVGIAPPI